MHRRTSMDDHSIRNSASTRSSVTVVSNTVAALGTLKRCGKNDRSISSEVDRLDFRSERNGASSHSHISLEVLDPTETDVTETSRTENEASLIREVTRSPSLLPIEELIERLREVNCDDDGELCRFHARTALLSVDEMTLLLMHVNRCEQEASILFPPQHNAVAVATTSSASSDRWKHHRTQSSCRNSALLTRCGTDVTETTTLPSPSNENLQHAEGSCSFSSHHSPMVPLSELIDRLVRGNPELSSSSSSSETRLSQMLQRNSKSAISLEELTRILHHINRSCSEAVGSAVSETAVGKNDKCNLQARSVDGSQTSNAGGKVCTRRRSLRSLCRSSNISRPSSSSSSSSSWTELECETATSGMELPASRGDARSLTLAHADEHHADDDDDSGFSLKVLLHSCDSSVTWYEGSDIDEISIDEEISIEDGDEQEEIPFPMRMC